MRSRHSSLAFLGTAYTSSIRLSAIQGFSPLKTSIAFVLIQGFALLLLPLISRIMHQVNPRWLLGGGFALGPAIIGAIALSRAASAIHAKVAASAGLQHGLNAFYHAAASAPAAQQQKLGAAVAAVKSGPLGANAVPATATLPNGHTAPLNPLKDVAFHALGNAYSFGYVVCGCAAAVAAVLVLLVLRVDAHHEADELAAAESEQYAAAELQRP